MQKRRIISFDVGIKNMAYCIFEVNNDDITNNNNNKIQIVDWKTINLMNEEDIIKTMHKCSCSSTKKNKKAINQQNTSIIICNKNEKYTKNGVYYCEKHAHQNQNGEYLIPTKEMEISNLKKMKIDELIKYYQSFLLLEDPITKLPLQNCKKQRLVEIGGTFFKEKSFELIVHKKQKSCKETDLISIGKNMKTELNKISNFELITDVIIENQISTIAARMNSIQGMLVQYFIMKQDTENETSLKIEFISSSNKLKGFISPSSSSNQNTIINNTLITATATTNIHQPNNIQKKTTYKEHKKDGIYHCLQFLEKNTTFKDWKYVLNTNKKDDYADCFLQGIWYLRKYELVTFIETYSIL
jgi:hypothetical protein